MKILIKNGLLFSGDNDQKAIVQDILIDANGLIQEIGTNILYEDENVEIIDAKGKWIVPGFVDSHTHYDAEILASPGLKESARHGVTTIILGSCSVSAVFNSPEDTADSFTRVEAIPREVMLPLLEKEKTWNTPKQWKAYINTLPLGINVASFIGHSDIRMKAMGIKRSLLDNVSATKKEEQEMLQLLTAALDEGFIGLSTMDNPWDKMDGDRYWSHKTPSFYSSWKERKSLVELLRERDAILQGAPNLVTRVNAFNYMLASTGIFRKPLKTTMIAMMDLIGDRYIYPLIAFASRSINLLGNANFRMQSPPCPFTVYYDGVDSVMFEEFPSGEALRHLAKELDKRNLLITDPKFRDNFKKEIKKKFAPKVWHKDLSKAVIIDCPDKSLIGKNFYEMAKERNSHPVDVFLGTIITYDKKIRWTTTIANDQKEKYKDLYNFPYNLISFSDAVAHLNNMAFYNFPLKMIQTVQDSIDNGNPIMSMEKCIWRLTKEQGDWFNLDCGHITIGKIADLVLLNPENLNNVTENVELEPIIEFGNYARLVNRNEGVIARVLVGGKTIFKNENFVSGYGKSVKYGRFMEKTNV
ncbi:amidohydrolase family protein [Flavobacterium sp. TAB 87]|uniref:N-acyl-D-amino-acid deacylase family protein n=1 Tax=Flavobacterium sp. TAB 87 TaxID=1729581 RepID=UPI00076C8D9E|nr:amidohydrolase family protein [Flavobacterium sp. TAB 87]KVV14844.1 N-acyl-D-aspartate deacylase [Flavobacterium sp. TAB 87]